MILLLYLLSYTGKNPLAVYEILPKLLRATSES
jgi:hypothetical protein